MLCIRSVFVAYIMFISLYTVWGDKINFMKKKYENNKINSGGERGKSADLRLAPPLAQVVL